MICVLLSGGLLIGGLPVCDLAYRAQSTQGHCFYVNKPNNVLKEVQGPVSHSLQDLIRVE